MLQALVSPIIFAHRGASAHAPENTLAAFQHALDDGSPALEFDVKLSADGHVVVIHDQTVDRTTDGHGKVGDLTLPQLRALDAGSWFDSAFRNQRIPTLEEVFTIFGHKILMNVELTNYASSFDQLVPRVALLIKEHNLGEHILFSSFLPHNLARCRRLLPLVPRGLLAFPGFKGALQRFFGRFMDLQAEHTFASDLTAVGATYTHKRGRKVFAYTVNDPAEIRRLFDCGVDGVFTDDPALALGILAMK